jgi:hypothetical protein
LWEFVASALDACRLLCYRAAGAARVARDAIAGVPLVLAMVQRWRLWRADRRRPKVTRQWVGPVRLDLVYDRRTGYRLVAWAVMETRGGVRSASCLREIGMPRKPAAAAPGEGGPRQAAPRPKVLDKTPLLASYLLDMQYEEGGGPREPSYLIIKAAGGEWLCTLKDPTEARQLRLRVSDLGTLYAALEALLSADSCPWEPDVWAERGRGRTPRKKGA